MEDFSDGIPASQRKRRLHLDLVLAWSIHAELEDSDVINVLIFPKLMRVLQPGSVTLSLDPTSTRK